ncbi:MAG: GNAT family N-acetyltransferase [Magnetococcus sp. DMHC-6]
MFRTEPMQKRYLSQVVQLEAEIASYPWSQGMFLEELFLNSFFRVVVQLPERVIGFLVARQFPDAWHLLNVGILPEFRRQSWARKLLTEWMEMVKQTPDLVLLLEVGVSNQPAIKLYESMGFFPIHRRHDYFVGKKGVEDAWLMQGFCIP